MCCHLEDLLRISELAAPAEERLVQLSTFPSASKAAVRIHLFSLLFEVSGVSGPRTDADWEMGEVWVGDWIRY